MSTQLITSYYTTYVLDLFIQPEGAVTLCRCIVSSRYMRVPFCVLRFTFRVFLAEPD